MDFCGCPQGPACARTHTRTRTHGVGRGSAGRSRADAAAGPGESGAGVTGWRVAGLRGSSGSNWSPAVGDHGLHSVAGLPTVTWKVWGSFFTPGPGPLCHVTHFPSPLSQRTHYPLCALGPGKSVSFLSLECLLYTSASLRFGFFHTLRDSLAHLCPPELSVMLAKFYICAV